MKKKTFFRRLLGITAISLLAVSCADDGFNEESFDIGVYGTQLEAVSADDITVTASADGTKQTISWPVVYGAGGYRAILTDLTANEVLVDSVIDGTSFAAARAEDNNYTISLQVLGNEDKNNLGCEAVVKTFNTFIESFATIPEGDIYSYFQSNPVPDNALTENLCYDLVPGGSYTLSDVLDFTNHKVTLRTTDQVNRAKVTYTGEKACLQSGTSFVIKYVDFDCSASSAAFFQMSEETDESILGLVSGTQNYYDVIDPITINGCNIDNVNGMFMYDNGKKYGIGTMLIKDCVVHLTTNTSSTVTVFNFYGGGIVSLTMQNSTFYNTGEQDHNYFVRYGNNARSTRMGYDTNLISYENCTFYNIAKTGQWGNYSGFNGQSCSYWVMTNCIFVDCSSNAVTRRFLGGSINSSHPTFANNTYMFDGGFEDCSSYDQSGTQIEEDPQFKNPAGGDFTISGATQVALGTGDPRWLP